MKIFSGVYCKRNISEYINNEEYIILLPSLSNIDIAPAELPSDGKLNDSIYKDYLLAHVLKVGKININFINEAVFFNVKGQKVIYKHPCFNIKSCFEPVVRPDRDLGEPENFLYIDHALFEYGK